MEHGHDALDRARTQRAGLLAAMVEVERRLAAPAAGHEWRAGMADALAGLRAALDRHVEAVEAPTGLLAQITTDAPRLAHAVDGLRGEHGDLGDRLASLEAAVAAETAPEVLRKEAVETLVAFTHHRHRGADLVYEAYTVDIGAGD